MRWANCRHLAAALQLGNRRSGETGKHRAHGFGAHCQTVTFTQYDSNRRRVNVTMINSTFMQAVQNVRFALGPVLALLLIHGLPAIAQDQVLSQPPSLNASSASPIPTGSLAGFEQFLDQHPNIEARLREDTTLANNPAFQKNHPQFSDFVGRHPALGTELAAKPRWLIHRELRYQSAIQITRGQIAEFDVLLDRHPDLEKQLTLHPKLLRDPTFLTSNPDLHAYVRRHLGLDHAHETKPTRIIKRERLHERIEKGKGESKN